MFIRCSSGWLSTEFPSNFITTCKYYWIALIIVICIYHFFVFSWSIIPVLSPYMRNNHSRCLFVLDAYDVIWSLICSMRFIIDAKAACRVSRYFSILSLRGWPLHSEFKAAGEWYVTTFVGRSAIKTQTRRVDVLKPPVPTADVNRKRTKWAKDMRAADHHRVHSAPPGVTFHSSWWNPYS